MHDTGIQREKIEFIYEFYFTFFLNLFSIPRTCSIPRILFYPSDIVLSLGYCSIPRTYMPSWKLPQFVIHCGLTCLHCGLECLVGLHCEGRHVMFYGTPFLTRTTRKFEPHVGRHVPLFTSNDKFEARRNNITTLQDSQDEISELTSKF